jgi:hypothetical protein
MAMSVYGVKPTAPVGENFRSSVWWWRPLWQYVNSLELLTEAQYMQGCVNDGEYEFTVDLAAAIALRLDEEIASGRCAAHVPKEPFPFNTEIALIKALPSLAADPYVGYMFTVRRVQEFADFARASGGFVVT